MTSGQRGVRLIGWLIIVFTAVMAAGQTRLGVPSYQDPGSSQWTAWAAPGAKAIGIMIVNLDNGDDEGYYTERRPGDPRHPQAGHLRDRIYIHRLRRARSEDYPAQDRCGVPQLSGRWHLLR